VTGDGPEHRLRSWAWTLCVLALSLYFAAHLVAAVAPMLVGVGATTAIGCAIWLIVRRNRW
jgi:uncharacterized membrane protein (DUF485 family)